jgi:hypothetical protein
VLCRALIRGEPLQVARDRAARGRREEIAAAVAGDSDVRTLSGGGYSPETLRAAMHFVARYDSFGEALSESLRFAGPANYCPVLVGAIAGARWGAASIPDSHLLHCNIGVNLSERLRDRVDAAATPWPRGGSGVTDRRSCGVRAKTSASSAASMDMAGILCAIGIALAVVLIVVPLILTPVGIAVVAVGWEGPPARTLEFPEFAVTGLVGAVLVLRWAAGGAEADLTVRPPGYTPCGVRTGSPPQPDLPCTSTTTSTRAFGAGIFDGLRLVLAIPWG